MSIFQRYGLKYSLSFLLGQERFSTHGGAPEHPDFCEGITQTVRVIKRSKNNGGMARNDRPINLEEDCWIGKNSKVEKKFNISTNHLHYNKTAVNALMSSKHFKITILRNPESQFVSSFKVTRRSTTLQCNTVKIFWTRCQCHTRNMPDCIPDVISYVLKVVLPYVLKTNLVLHSFLHNYKSSVAL